MELAEWYDPNATYICAFCGEIIEHVGFDPCQVNVDAARIDPEDPGLWSFPVHAMCVRDALDPVLRAEVGHLYEPGNV
jgi:hypothetical protein